MFMSQDQSFIERVVPEFKVNLNHQAKATFLFEAASEKIATEEEPMAFELIGLDFMVDQDLQVYLIEVNKNPCLSTLSPGQHTLVSDLLRDTFALAIDPLFKLQSKVLRDSPNNFELVHVHFF